MGFCKTHCPRTRKWFAFLVALTVFVVPWALYFVYLYKAPLMPVTVNFHLFWSSTGDSFDKSKDGLVVSRILKRSKKEKVVFELPEEITLKRVRLDPIEGKLGVVTLYGFRVYDGTGNVALHVAFKHENPGWTIADCNQGDAAEGWECYTYGNLAVASPLYDNVKAKRVEIEVKTAPLDSVVGFLSWVSDKLF